ncbi:MAG: FecR family protein [Sneathiellaceae bacterium]
MTDLRLFAAMALLCPLLLAGPAQAAESVRTCRVERVEGTTVRYRQGEDWVALAVTALPEGATRVETGGDTRVEIRCSDGIVVTIGFGTRVDLSHLTGPQDSRGDVLLDLVDGIIGIVAPEGSWSSFRVRTPLAIASIRSTEWLVEHEAGQATAVFVRRGTVAVEAGGTERALSAGEGVTIAADGQPAAVMNWGQPRIARTAARLGFAWQ